MVKKVEKIKKSAIVEPIPDKRKITKRQATRLAEIAHVDVKKLTGKTIASVYENLKWHVDPQLLLFRRVCGQVVKRNPGSGELETVPNATVHVEDTDCSFLSYFPSGSPWCWFFPLICHREEITTVKTDKCGRFCVWIPRWDIDWIWKWRHSRICFPYIIRPRIWEILEDLKLLPEPPIIRKPPFPDPPPFARLKPGAIEQVRDVLGTTVADQLEQLVGRQTIGESAKELDVLLNMRSPITLPPPVPNEMRDAMLDKNKSNMDAAINLDEKYVSKLDYNRYIGPFRRCVDVYFKEWVPFFDVPDITFRVTQDVDGDGTEETIYSEGFFDVRWNSGSIPNVILEASAIALSSPICDGPVIDPNTCIKPTIVTAGLMPLQAPYHSNTNGGYALKVNRPRSGGLSDSPHVPSDVDGEAPYWRTVQLHGCQRFNNAKYYRLMYSYEENAYVPFTGEKWLAPKVVGSPIWVVPDSNGWYEVLPSANLAFPHWLINWQTWRYPNGKYTVKLQIANNAKTDIRVSDPVSLVVDNVQPIGVFNTIRWRAPGATGYSSWQTLPAACPIIRRPAGATIELEVDYHVSAPHFRNVELIGHSCKGVNLIKQSTADKFDHWHTNTGNNSRNAVAVFEVPSTPPTGSYPEGAYTVGLNIHGRAFNPAGSDSGPGSNWHYDVSYSHSYPRRHIAIIDL